MLFPTPVLGGGGGVKSSIGALSLYPSNVSDTPTLAKNAPPSNLPYCSKTSFSPEVLSKNAIAHMMYIQTTATPASGTNLIPSFLFCPSFLPFVLSFFLSCFLSFLISFPSIRQDKRIVLTGERRDKVVQVSEVKQGLRRLRLACSLGVAARDLASATVEVPRDNIGRVRRVERRPGKITCRRKNRCTSVVGDIDKKNGFVSHGRHPNMSVVCSVEASESKQRQASAWVLVVLVV